MGRFYYGDINGKFWFGVQSSDDASEFGIEPEQMYSFYGCGCSILEEDLEDTAFCSNCYDSYKDQLEQTIEDRSGVEGDLVYCEDDEISYNFSERELDYVKEKVDELEKKYGQFMTHFSIKGTNSFEYDYEPTDPPPSEKQLPFVARLCLGKMILNCLEKKGECVFSCDT